MIEYELIIALHLAVVRNYSAEFNTLYCISILLYY